MTDEQRGRAFGRSWRAPPGEGSGLGLAIARRLVETDEDEINSQTYPAAVSMRQFAFHPV